ncbi:MAG: FHA domain-containing protein [Betaproteobacteria bacterium]
MSWFLEHLHRDGSVLARLPVPAAVDAPVELRIGRALDNDLVLDDPHAAAHHARVEVGVDGVARLVDLGSANGIVPGRGKRAATYEIRTDEPYHVGQSLVRIRSSEWPLLPERLLSRRAIWPLGLLGLMLVLGHTAWDLWLKDVQQGGPPYFYGLSSAAAALCIWSAVYALFGRLISGTDRFFSHLAIASAGYLSGSLILNLLEMLAFSSSWLWPIRITQPVIVLVAAMTVRFHLRLADPRHWPVTRYAVSLVAVIAIIVPLAQHWATHKRLTNVQTLKSIEYPAVRLAQPVPLADYMAKFGGLKEKVDKARKSNEEGAEGANYDFDSTP